MPVGPCQGFYVLGSTRARYSRARQKAKWQQGRRKRSRAPLRGTSRKKRMIVDPGTGLLIEDDASDTDVDSNDEEIDPDANLIDCEEPEDLDQLYANATLHRENRCLNLGQREESFVIQYLTLGGYKHFFPDLHLIPDRLGTRTGPDLVCSGMHAGAGQQVFGWSPFQRADLMAAFYSDSADQPTVIHYHNYHGARWHYSGHLSNCPDHNNRPFEEHSTSRRMDEFRRGLAEAFSLVNPERVLFRYSTSYACQMMHGMQVPSLVASDVLHSDVKTALLLDRPQDSWLPFESDCLNPSTVEAMILSGQINGFVTIKGGREHPDMLKQDPAGSRFGFCVQSYAPKPNQVSLHTKRQIAEFYDWIREPIDDYDSSTFDQKRVDKYLSAQNPRTVNSTTFHDQETVSTTYLRWLMKERRFEKFKITHLMIYEFKDWSKEFLMPILQSRHEYKQQGNTVAAECLKLIANGSFGYNGLESCNYDEVRIMTDDAIRKRRTKDLAHLTLKHLTMIGVVRLKTKKKPKKKKKKKNRRRRRRRHNSFIQDEADEDDHEEEEEEEEEEDEQSVTDSDDEEEEEEEEEEGCIDFDAFNRLKNSVVKEKPMPSLPDIPDHLQQVYQQRRPVKEKPSKQFLDLEEILIGAAEENELPVKEKSKKEEEPDKYTYRWQLLYAVVIGGKARTLHNNLPKAVAVLSNSKQLFLSHLNVMFQCLDPGLAELCYIDTDSCIWSLAYQNLGDCLLTGKKEEWNRASIIADEAGKNSCHGKMKLEGTYWCGKFKTMKIYRLYDDRLPTEIEDADESVSIQLTTAYTRCKGINRWIANRLPDFAFDPHRLNKSVVHRSTLKPSRTGQMMIQHEARSLAVPFNLKRYTLNDNIHTLPISYGNFV